MLSRVFPLKQLNEVTELFTSHHRAGTQSASSCFPAAELPSAPSTPPSVSNPATKLPLHSQHLLVPDVPTYKLPSATPSATGTSPSSGILLPSTSPPTVHEHEPSHLNTLSNPPATTGMSILDGASDFILNNSQFNNIAGNATIFNFNDKGPLTAEARSLFISHIAGTIPLPEFVKKLDKHILAQYIRDLPRAKAAYNDYSPTDKRRRLCFERTREALLGDIGIWITELDESQLQVYVLSGLAGIGKSTIARTVASRADGLHFLGASFFFSRDEIDCRNAEKLFTTIAYQLCGYDRRYAKAIGNVLQTKQGSDAISQGPLEQLDGLILEPLREIIKLRPRRPIVIVIDALDECDDHDGPVVLAALNRLVQELPSVKVVLTLRPQPHLQNGLESHKVFYLQNIEDKVIDGDIRLYLKHSLSSEQVKMCLRLRQDWGANDEEIEYLVRAAGRLFIMASTATRFILDTTVHDPRSQMEVLKIDGRLSLDGMDSFYVVVLRRAIPPRSNAKIVERFKTVVGSILYAQEPLSIATLEHFTYPWSVDAITAVLTNLQSVIVLDQDTPRIYHESLFDFLTDINHCTENDFHIASREQHTRITTRCFRIMNEHLKRNILGLRTPAQFMDNNDGLAADNISEDHVRKKIPPELRYACTYWINHFEDADTGNTNLMKEVQQFGNEHLLHWFEALSWIRKLDLAHRTIRAALKLLESTLPAMHETFNDASRFISKFYAVIERSALHTYHSALPFTAAQSLLNKKYNQQATLFQLEGVPDQWDALITTFQHGADNIDRVAFSADSSRLASQTGKKLRLWDATSGAPVNTFQGDVIAFSENFSVAAMSKDSAVTLCDVATDIPIATLSHTTEVVMLTLSFDGARLAAGLSDGTVSLWDTRQRKLLASPFSFTGRDRTQLVFSPSSYNLAVMSHGYVQLWDGITGNFIVKLVHGYIDQVAFSHDGSRLASIAFGTEGLALWNGENGNFITSSQGIFECMAISPDGSVLATSLWRDKKAELFRVGKSVTRLATFRVREPDHVRCLALSSSDMLAVGSDEAVTLYDLKTCTAITSRLQFLSPRSLAFSPDHTRLAAGNKHGVVHMWDIPTLRVSIPSSEEQSRCVTALAFSPDCSRLAAGFKDGTLELWDTRRSSRLIAVHKEHSGQIFTVAFSCGDGERLASGSEDTTVNFWNGADGALMRTLGYSFRPWVTSVAFSSSALAVATDSSITLWDLETLRHILALNGEGHFLSLSQDNFLLASAYNHYADHSSHVTVWYLKERTPVSTFTVDSVIEGLYISPDGFRLVARLGNPKGGFEFHDIGNQRSIQRTEGKGNSWVPYSSGMLITRKYDHNYGYRLVGQFRNYGGGIPILWVPRDVNVQKFATGASMFALGLEDGRIVFGRYSTTSANYANHAF